MLIQYILYGAYMSRFIISKLCLELFESMLFLILRDGIRVTFIGSRESLMNYVKFARSRTAIIRFRAQPALEMYAKTQRNAAPI